MTRIKKIKLIWHSIQIFFKELIVYVWNFIKKYFPFSYIIIVLTFVVSILTLVETIKGRLATDDNLNITKQEVEKGLDPLIHYKYLSDEKRFEILSSDDVEIRTVSWILPIKDEFLKINEFSNDLILDELKYSFLLHLSIDAKKPMDIIKNFIDCHLFGSEFYKGIPMVTEVEFRRRGVRETFTQVDLVRIRGSERDGLYIYVEKPGASAEEEKKFIAETQQEDYKVYQDFLKDYNLKGECGIRFGYPDKNFW